jgi:Bacterial PH domain
VRVNDASFAYPHCPFREVTHAAARRAPVIRRIAVGLWPSARRAEQVDISAAGITASGLFGSVAMGWQDVATTRRGRTPSGRRRLVVRTRDGRRLEVASTLPGFERLCAAVAGHAQA